MKFLAAIDTWATALNSEIAELSPKGKDWLYREEFSSSKKRREKARESEEWAQHHLKQSLNAIVNSIQWVRTTQTTLSDYRASEMADGGDSLRKMEMYGWSKLAGTLTIHKFLMPLVMYRLHEKEIPTNESFGNYTAMTMRRCGDIAASINGLVIMPYLAESAGIAEAIEKNDPSLVK